MFTTTERRVLSRVEFTERQLVRVRTTGEKDTTIVVNLNPETAAAARIDDAESMLYDVDRDVGGLVGYGTTEFLDGRSYPNAARVHKSRGETTSTTIVIPKGVVEEAFGVTLDDLQQRADLRLVVLTAPGVVLLRRVQTVDYDVDHSVFDDIDAQLVLEAETDE